MDDVAAGISAPSLTVRISWNILSHSAVVISEMWSFVAILFIVVLARCAVEA